jgi:hypothetical protein
MYPHERSLVEKLKDKPFAIIGVNSDRDREKLKKVVEEKKLTWRSFWDGGDTTGPIASAWNVTYWPTVFLLDHAGVIRYKDVSGKDLDAAIEKLVDEAERAAKGGGK